MIPIELDQEIREGVFKTLPQIMDIQNEELRNKTADAWTYALQINGFKQIEEMPGSAGTGPGFLQPVQEPQLILYLWKRLPWKDKAIDLCGAAWMCDAL